MKSRHLTLVLFLYLFLISPPSNAKQPEISYSNGKEVQILGGPALTSRTEVDSMLVMGPWGSGAAFNGQFQDQQGDPDWNDWTHRDLSIPEEGNHWHVDSYQAEGLAGHGADNLAAWCGMLDFESCNETDPEGGYGDSWADPLDWVAQVEDPAIPCIITIDAWINLDLEPGYDYLKLLLREPGLEPNYEVIAEYDGAFSNQHLTWEINIPAGQYSGPGSNEVELRFIVDTDGSWSDEDCLFPSAGACQLDDITVHLDNGDLTTFDDFQSGDLGNWVANALLGRGDFSQLRSGLEDLDDCRTNYSPQVCFIDDGIVVPGTGGSMCIDWCYGPEGYIVNPNGGLIPFINYYGLKNAVESPVMPWPESSDGGLLEFDAYVHETLTMDSPGIFYTWDVRSTSSLNPEDIRLEPWLNDNFLYYGGPEYRRAKQVFDTHLAEGSQFVQVRLVLIQVQPWSWWFENGTPAPYFDNVRVTALDTYGPKVSLWDLDLANDSFPASGVLNAENLATNSVRFDSGRNLDGSGQGYLAQDYLKIAVSVRGDGEYLQTPRMHYRLIPNPVFDPVRNSGLPNVGYVEGSQVGGSTQFRFDLPDTGFFYPGDIIHYCFSATQVTSDGVNETALVPADTTGFSQGPWGANSQKPGLETFGENFIVRGLPSISESFSHPQILIWDDACDPAFTEALRHDLNQAQAWTYHGGFDLYRRLSETSKRPLSWSATPEILAGYDAVFYFSGSTKEGILGHLQDPSEANFQLLIQWLEDNQERGMFFSGDHILTTLDNWSVIQDFITTYLGVQFVEEDLSPLINGMLYPEVLSLDLGPFTMGDIDGWVVSGYCPDSRIMTAVQPTPDALRIAEFAGPNGQGAYYPYSALTAFYGPNQSLSFSMPYDFRRIVQPSGWDGGGVSLRSRILMHLASHFIGMGFPVVDMSPVPDPAVFSTSAYPNPFNPATTINFNLPRSGHLSLKIYNLRGELVRTLIDEASLAGPGRIVWRGDEQAGSAAASGVYFYKLKLEEDQLTEKLLLIK